MKRLFFALLLFVFSSASLAAEVRRIVSLAPHVTEMLFAVGAGERVVGAVAYSDYPEAAKSIPRVGGYRRLDLEAVIALKPDLVVAWRSGSPKEQVARLETMGLRVVHTDPFRLEDIPAELEWLGEVIGTVEAAGEAAAAFRAELARLRGHYAQRPKVRVFYQIWDRPLMSVGGGHLISDVIALCGGENLFGELTELAPRLDLEAVLAGDPEAIVASGMGEARPEWLDMWRQWPRLTATARGNLFFIPPDLIQRHTPRILQGAARLCEHLETARSRRRETAR